MCVALIKNKGIDLPQKSVLEICFKNNPDGAGFAYCRDGKNYIHKGFFTFNGFYKALEKANIQKSESALIHFRVATHGKINIENCHPFPITNQFVKMTNPMISTTNAILVHNGKLSINITNRIYSDSMHLAKSFYGFDRQNNKDFIEFIIRPTEKNKRGNRIAILENSGDIQYYGEGWIEENGILFSNDSYLINSTYKSNIKKKKNQAASKNKGYTYISKCSSCKELKSNVTCHQIFKENYLCITSLCVSCATKKGFVKCETCNNFVKSYKKNQKRCNNCIKSFVYNNPFDEIKLYN